MRGVFGDQRECRLARRIDRQVGRAAMHVDRQYVDDRTRLLPAPHVGDRPLHQEEGRLRVDRKEPVPQRRGGRHIEPRSVSPAAFTSASMRPNFSSAASATTLLAPASVKSTATKSLSRRAPRPRPRTAAPRALSRPQIRISLGAIASRFQRDGTADALGRAGDDQDGSGKGQFIVAQLDFYLEKNRKIVPRGQAT